MLYIRNSADFLISSLGYLWYYGGHLDWQNPHHVDWRSDYKIKHARFHKLPSKMLHYFWSPYQTNHLLTKAMSQIFFKNSSLLVQDWSSCCHLLLWARNYKISNLKCYIVLLFVHFKRRNNINRKMFCVLLFTWDHSNRFSWTYYFTNALLQKTGWWYKGPSSLTLDLNAACKESRVR